MAMLLEGPPTLAPAARDTLTLARILEPAQPGKIEVAGLNFYYGEHRVLHDINLTIGANQVTALIGPTGCGKSTFIRSLNRMNDIVPGARVEGEIRIDGTDIYASAVDVVD